MARTRVKGSDVTIVVTGPTGSEPISAVKSFEATAEIEIVSDGYLGEQTERKDSNFKGFKGSMEVDPSSADYFRFMKSVVDRAKRRTNPIPNFSVLCTLAFPDGRRPRVQLNEVEFGDVPIKVGGKSEFATSSIDFEASDGLIILA
jgi:hypothetical protein